MSFQLRDHAVHDLRIVRAEAVEPESPEPAVEFGVVAVRPGEAGGDFAGGVEARDGVFQEGRRRTERILLRRVRLNEEMHHVGLREVVRRGLLEALAHERLALRAPLRRERDLPPAAGEHPVAGEAVRHRLAPLPHQLVAAAVAVDLALESEALHERGALRHRHVLVVHVDFPAGTPLHRGEEALPQGDAHVVPLGAVRRADGHVPQLGPVVLLDLAALVGGVVVGDDHAVLRAADVGLGNHVAGPGVEARLKGVVGPVHASGHEHAVAAVDHAEVEETRVARPPGRDAEGEREDDERFYHGLTPFRRRSRGRARG